MPEAPKQDTSANKKSQYSLLDWSPMEFAAPEKNLPTLQSQVTPPQVTDAALAGAPQDAASATTKAAPVSSNANVAKPEPAVLSVSDLNRLIKKQLEGEFATIWLRGEISNFKAHTSGHYYFSLKDSKAQISAVMFRGFNTHLKFRPADGMEVLVRGKVTVYEPRGNYQIFCELMEPVGAGALQKAFEQLKAKLQKEGLFDSAKKRALPSMPSHVAIVTSPTGAAIRDMLNVLGRRFKGLRITVIPTKVQGEQAAPEIVRAIQLAQKLSDIDVMIVGRGGGSIEDLWAFNEEIVARAIASARVPVISAVGHEIDFTIADFVADLRAPTPSAAAELVVKNTADLQQKISRYQSNLAVQMRANLARNRERVLNLRRALVDPKRYIQDLILRCDELSSRLERSVLRVFFDWHQQIELLRERMGSPANGIRMHEQNLKALCHRLATAIANRHSRKRQQLERWMSVLDSISPLRIVERGFSIVKNKDGKIIKDAAQIAPGETLNLRFAKGEADVSVIKTT